MQDWDDALSVASSATNLALEEEEEVDETRAVRILTRKETQGVNAWKVTVLLTILLSGVGVSFGTFYFLDKQEEDDFKSSVRTVLAVCCICTLSPEVSLASRSHNHFLYLLSNPHAVSIKFQDYSGFNTISREGSFQISPRYRAIHHNGIRSRGRAFPVCLSASV
jgi:hypothetical protein